MFFDTRPKMDPEIELGYFKSETLKKLCLTFNSHYEREGDRNEVYFTDLADRLFFSFADVGGYYIPDVDKLPEGFEGPRGVRSSLIRAIYVAQPYRGRNLQGKVIGQILRFAEETGEVINIFADPYFIPGSHARTGREALVDFIRQGCERPEDYSRQLILQVTRLLKAGFEHYICPDAEITLPHMQLAYVPESAEDYKKIIMQSYKREMTLNADKVREIFGDAYRW